MERRKHTNVTVKSSELPVDFTKMVTEVFHGNFEDGLKRLQKIRAGNPRFDVSGKIYPDEVIVAVSLAQEGQLSATTAYASIDFDPRASSPTIEDVLGAGVDGIASIFDHLFSTKHPARLEQLAQDSLSAMEDIPFEWTPFKIEKRTVHLLVDKANLAMEREAEEFLRANDPDYEARLAREQAETEQLFVTGKKPQTTH